MFEFISSPPPGNLLYMGEYSPVLVTFSLAIAIFASFAALQSQQVANGQSKL